MVETRAQGAAQRGRNPQDQDQDVPIRKCQRPKIYQKSTKGPPIQGSRKRAIEDVRDLGSESSPKCQQISRPSAPQLSNSALEIAALEVAAPDDAASDNADSDNPIEFWIRESRWPRRYFEPEMEYLLARKRSLSTLGRRKRANSALSETPSDQKPRDDKSAQYRDTRYETLLATKGIFMETSEEGIAEESKHLYRNLLEGDQDFPQGTIFDSDIFQRAYKYFHNKNEARIIQDISRLLVPSAETFSLYNKELRILTESVNEGWNNSIPLTGTRPQPDYSIGFRREAFSDDQLAKLAPFIGEFLGGDLSFFMATYYIYFPFLACEVKCGAAALDVADRQNAHSMTLAVRGVVELFRLVKRENEVNRQILSFSISHDHRSVRIYGYYPVIDRKDTKYYRHPIREFSFTEMDGKEKWTTYRFTKNVYDTWVPAQFKKICSAIDQLPLNMDFGVAAPSEPTGLPQGLENLVPSEADSASLLVDEDGQSNKAGQMTSPVTSTLKPGPAAKRRRSPVKKS